MSELEQRIGIEQVRVGLYIRLDSWTDHPFLFSSFKIRSEKQVQQLRSLGISHVLYDRSKSDSIPLPPPKASAPHRLPRRPIRKWRRCGQKNGNGGNSFRASARHWGAANGNLLPELQPSSRCCATFFPPG